MATWKTGKFRTLTMTGTMSGEIANYFIPPANTFYKLANFYYDALSYGVKFKVWSATGSPPLYDFSGAGYLEIIDTDTGASASNHFWSSPMGSQLVDITASGTWSVSYQVEEWATTYIPSNSSAVNGTNFPYYGGSAEGDSCPAEGVRYYELSVGGTKSCSLTVNGVTVSTSGTIAAGVPVVYGISYGVDNVVFSQVAMFAYAVSPGPHPVLGYSTSLTATTTPTNGVPVNVNQNWPDSQTNNTLDLRNGISMYSHLAAGETTYGTPAYASTSYTSTPGGEYTFSGRLRSFGQAFPASELCCVNDWYLHTTDITLNPAGSYGPWTQTDFGYSYSLTGNTASGSQTQIAPVFVYLYNLAPDDTRDWRCMLRGFSWSALSLSRAPSEEIDPCTALTNWTAGSNTTLSLSGGVMVAASGGTGSVTLAVPHAVRVWEVYRYLQFTGLFTAPAYDNTAAYTVGQIVVDSGILYQAIASTTGNAPPNASYWSVYTPALTVAIAAKQWQLSLSVSSAGVSLDLCCAYNETEATDTTQTRFPIASPGGFPINTDPTNQYKLGWGVQYCDSVVISGIPNGCSITISDVSLVSKSGGQAALTLLEPFLDFYTGWTDSSDTTSLQDYLFIESDYRVLDLPAMALITPVSGSPSYQWYTIAQLRTMLAYFLGLTATLGSAPSDGYHGTGQLALCLGGLGATYDWTSLGWKDWVDLALPQGAIPAQDLWDEVQVYPGAGNVWQQSGPYGGATPVAMSKSLRAQADGLVFDLGGNAKSGQKIKTYETSTPATGEGSAVSSTLGQYFTGLPFAFGNVGVTTKLDMGETPVLSSSETPQNRQRYRTSFRYLPPKLQALAYDVSTGLRHCLVYAVSTTDEVIIGCAGNQLPQTFNWIDAGFTAKWVRVRFQDHGAAWPIGMFYGDGTTAYFSQTFDEGTTWSTPLNMASGSIGDFEEGADGLRWLYKLVSPDGGTTWNVWNQLMDSQLNVVRAWTITNVTGADQEPIAVRESPSSDGSWRIGLWYSIGGVQTLKFSFDGLNFS